MKGLLKRLTAIAELIHAQTVADIGADHALLSVYLAEKDETSRVIIGELGDGPYRRACLAVRSSKAALRIDVRQGDGLEVLREGEVETVVLAGMGGSTIVEILARDWEKSRTFRHFILQPMSKPGLVRQALSGQGWPIVDEKLVGENGHFFAIIHSRPGKEPYRLTPLELEFGPEVLKADTAVKRAFLHKRLDDYRRISRQVQRSGRRKAQELLPYYNEKIHALEAILHVGSGE